MATTDRNAPGLICFWRQKKNSYGKNMDKDSEDGEDTQEEEMEKGDRPIRSQCLYIGDAYRIDTFFKAYREQRRLMELDGLTKKGGFH